jgi:hypothetical protein
MSQRIQVGGQTTSALNVARGLVAIAIGVGIVLALTVEFGFIVVPVIGVLLCVPLEIYAASMRRKRAWIEDLGVGFGYTRGNEDLPFRDEQVEGVAIKVAIDHSQMNSAKTVRDVQLWMEGSPQPLQLHTSLEADALDPLGDLLHRLNKKLIDRQQRTLDKGGTVSGDGWQLTRTTLTMGPPGREQQFPLTNVASVDVFDNHTCVWRVGEEQAAAKVRYEGRNNYALPALVAPLLPTRQAETKVVDETSLGRILFERKQNVIAVVVSAIVFMVFTLIGIVAGFESIGLAIAALILIVVVAVLAGFVALSMGRLKCHERGVQQTSAFGSRSLRYDQVERFTFSAIRQYVNGGYTGTTLNLAFDPLPSSGAKRIVYNTSVKGEDGDLDALRDHIARVIAARMSRDFAAGQTVEWTDSITFLPTGIQYVPSGMFGKKAPALIPFEEYGGFNMDQGVFYLFHKGKAKSVHSEKTSVVNFFPGFYLLLAILHSENGAEEQPAAEKAG